LECRLARATGKKSPSWCASLRGVEGSVANQIAMRSSFVNQKLTFGPVLVKAMHRFDEHWITNPIFE
jgi:hypothetical protein